MSLSPATISGSPAISVVIPTFNRPHELRLCLEGFTQQTVPQSEFEIIVVDDGSTVDMTQCASGFERALNLRSIRIAHAGPGAARNVALKLARAPLLLLYDDDIRPLPDIVEYCLDFHRAHPAEEDTALLQFGPDPAILDSLFAAWAFDMLYPFPNEPEIGGWLRFWSGTLTSKTSLFRHGHFNPAYQMVEDGELGFRLSRSVDLRVHYEPRLTGMFTRGLTLPQICRRQYVLGYFSHVLAREYRAVLDFSPRPYNHPEKYLVKDPQVLAAMLASARAMESRLPPYGRSASQPPRLLSSLWSAAETHARAEGWMACRDGRPAEPPGTIGPVLETECPEPEHAGGTV
jgi:glycosyltransferase involved in cell wall biosynthesis